MEIRLSREALVRGLYLAQGIADRRATMPIVSHVLLRSDGKQKVVCAATDMAVSLTAEIKADVKKEGGLAVGAKHLHDIVKGLPGEDVVIRRADNHWAEVRAGKAEFKLVGVPERDFPKLPDPREVAYAKIDAKLLAEMIGKTAFAASADETRPHLSGVLFEAEGGRARMVATDGHRLAKVERDWKEAPSFGAGLLVPRKGLQEIRRLIEGVEGAVEIGTHQGQMFVRGAGAALSVKLSDAQFPPYGQVIPPENDKVVTVGRSALLDALRRVALMASDRTSGVRVELAKDALRISSDNPDLGEAREEIEIGYAGEALSVGFNARYLIDLLEQIGSEEVKLELAGELDPALVRPVSAEEYLGVVMPMRI